MARPTGLDPEVIEQLYEMLAFAGPDAICEIFQLYLDDVPQRVCALEQAFRTQDADALRRAAHGLRGSSVSIGADVLAELCWELEEAAASGPTDIAPILRESERVVGLVETEMAKLGGALRLAQSG